MYVAYIYIYIYNESDKEKQRKKGRKKTGRNIDQKPIDMIKSLMDKPPNNSSSNMH
jgi:hypothetical protein